MGPVLPHTPTPGRLGQPLRARVANRNATAGRCGRRADAATSLGRTSVVRLWRTLKQKVLRDRGGFLRKHLKATIFQRDYTQRELAKHIGMREDRLSEIVCAAATPRDDERAAIAAALGVENTDDLWAVVVSGAHEVSVPRGCASEHPVGTDR